jgi:Phospholipase B
MPSIPCSTMTVIARGLRRIACASGFQSRAYSGFRRPGFGVPALSAGALCFLGIVCAELAGRAAPAGLGPEQQQFLAKAARHERDGWIYAHIEGGPRERGFQEGYLLAKELGENLKTTRLEWEHESAMTWPWLVQHAAALFAGKIDAEDLAELGGIAEGATAAGVKVSPDEITAYNGIIELSGYWWPTELKKIQDAPAPPVRQSCSSFIATGSWTKDGNVVLGHNTMMGYADVPPNVVADIVPAHGHHILWQTCAGWIHSGTDFFLTDAGLVGSETTIGGFDGFDTNGIPEFVRMRRATQDAGSIDQWCDIMKRGNNGGYANAWLIGDIHSKEIARLELGLKDVGFERSKDGYFAGSNVAENLKILRFETSVNETDIRLSSVARRVRWKQLISENRGRIDAPLAERFEADHYDAYLGQDHPGGRSLCGHFELDREPAGSWPGVPYGCAGTVDAKVVDASMAKGMSFAGRWGSACGRSFDATAFLAAHPQFDWMSGILKSRPSEPWTEFKAGEAPSQGQE